MAQNESVGQFTNMGVGLGTMAGVGGALGGMVGSNVRDAVSEAGKTSENPNAMEAFKAKIEKINMMKEAGLLSEEEFKSMKEKLLSDIL